MSLQVTLCKSAVEDRQREIGSRYAGTIMCKSLETLEQALINLSKESILPYVNQQGAYPNFTVQTVLDKLNQIPAIAAFAKLTLQNKIAVEIPHADKIDPITLETIKRIVGLFEDFPGQRSRAQQTAAPIKQKDEKTAAASAITSAANAQSVKTAVDDLIPKISSISTLQHVFDVEELIRAAVKEKLLLPSEADKKRMVCSRHLQSSQCVYLISGTLAEGLIIAENLLAVANGLEDSQAGSDAAALIRADVLKKFHQIARKRPQFTDKAAPDFECVMKRMLNTVKTLCASKALSDFEKGKIRIQRAMMEQNPRVHMMAIDEMRKAIQKDQLTSDQIDQLGTIEWTLLDKPKLKNAEDVVNLYFTCAIPAGILQCKLDLLKKKVDQGNAVRALEEQIKTLHAKIFSHQREWPLPANPKILQDLKGHITGVYGNDYGLDLDYVAVSK